MIITEKRKIFFSFLFLSCSVATAAYSFLTVARLYECLTTITESVKSGVGCLSSLVSGRSRQFCMVAQ
jgi:hypothetical protein